MKLDIMQEWEAAKKKADQIYSGVASKKVSVKPVELSDKRYNIHKRSLPPGIDKIVYFNVPLETADMLCEKFLHPKSFYDQPSSTKTLIYYDVIPMDAKPSEFNRFNLNGGE